MEERTERLTAEVDKATTALAAAGVINAKQSTAVRSVVAVAAACIALLLGVYNITFGDDTRECQVDLTPGTAVVVTPTTGQ